MRPRAPSVLALVAAAALLPGCALLDAPAAEEPAPRAATGGDPASASFQERDVPPPAARTDLPVSIRVADRWVKPSDEIVANATAPEGAIVSWFLAPRNPVAPGVERIDHVPETLRVVAAGSASVDARMAQPGRYSYEARGLPGVRFNVTVVASLPRGGSGEVLFVEDAHGARFAPAETVVGPGAGVYVRNLAAREVEPVRVDQMLRVAPDGPGASFAPPRLLGDYDVVAVARDAGSGWGLAGVRVVVDSRKPDPTAAIGPWTGVFATLPQAEEPDRRAFEARFEVASLRLAFNASSDAPGEPAVRVRV
ncbi:MAG TPA: hypothetical protein VHH36_01005, partial [Candidatus Thermoplasmatota archaeon]|nr:hypothetical protein [Candidatus Thermoplasmatota archaeon]